MSSRVFSDSDILIPGIRFLLRGIRVRGTALSQLRGVRPVGCDLGILKGCGLTILYSHPLLTLGATIFACQAEAMAGKVESEEKKSQDLSSGAPSLINHVGEF